MMSSMFLCASWPSVCRLWRNVCWGLLPSFLLGCLLFWYWASWTVYFGDESLVSKYFSHSEGCLSVFLMVSLAVQSFWVQLVPIVVFVTVGPGSKKILLWFMSKSILPMFSSKSFMSLKCLAVHLGLWSISSLFLCMVLWSVLISLFYI